MAHTPGPWRQHSEAPDRIIVNGSCVYQVHDITTPDGFAANGYGQPNPDDVRLMAAAPELFDLLRECSSALADLLSDADPSGLECQEQWACVAECKRAIAKAEGRGE